MRKALVLKRETLAELTTDELAGVAGASTVITPALIVAILKDVIATLPTGTCA
jgi:hypothetical protein